MKYQTERVWKRVLMLASVASMIDQFNMPNIRLLQDMGYEVHVACNFKKGNTCDAVSIQKLQTDLNEIGVIWHQWDCPRNPNAVYKCMIAYIQLYDLTKCYPFDLIHCHSPIGGALARIVAHIRGIPVIYTAHGFHFYRGAPLKNWFLYYPVEKMLAHWTDVLITLNKEDYAFAKRNLAAEIIYRIPGVGVDIEKFAGTDLRREVREQFSIPRDAVLLLSVGELNSGKNHRMVMEAFAKLDKDKNDVYYMICGQGRLCEELLQYAKKLGIDKRVRFTGYLENIVAAYQAADIFVFPSKREGMPVALIEAMASGLPCVVSDIRGNRELSIDSGSKRRQERAGNILFRLDRPKELVCALQNLIQDAQLRTICGDCNRKRSAHYSNRIVNRHMKKIYQRCDAFVCAKTEKLH